MCMQRTEDCALCDGEKTSHWLSLDCDYWTCYYCWDCETMSMIPGYAWGGKTWLAGSFSPGGSDD